MSLMSSISCRSKKDIIDYHNETTILISGEYVDIRNFGAIPSDGKDDSKAIQAAIDFAMMPANPSIVYCPPGIYRLDKGVLIANQLKSGEFRHITMTIIGSIKTYASDQRIGSSTVFKQGASSFGIAVQKGRNVVIKNIVFDGPSIYGSSITEYLNDFEGRNVVARKNQYSPSCAIAIDPFHSATPEEGRYPDFIEYYRSVSGGGTSMLNIEGCSFKNHYIAIANNPSNGVRNGDNIKVSDSHVSNCYTFWSSGQSQSRSNSIRNVYATFVHTFFSGEQIGKKNGTPPMVSNLNLAGCCKYFAYFHTGFSPLYVTQSHVESLWSLGFINTTDVSFTQTQIKFIKPNNDYFLAPFHLYSSRSVSFKDCTLEYFNNCKSKIPFILISKKLTIDGGYVEGGVVVANGITNSGGDELHNVDFINTTMRCENSIISMNDRGLVKGKIFGQILVGGAQFLSSEGVLYKNDGKTYDVRHIEKSAIDNDSIEKKITFSCKEPGSYRIGDNLFVDGQYDYKFDDDRIIKLRLGLGYVSHIEGNVITMTGGSNLIRNKEYDIYCVEFPKIYPKSTLKLTEGSDIAELLNGGNFNTRFLVGQRVESRYLVPGTYIKSVEGSRVVLSTSATASSQLEISGFIRSDG